MKRTRRSVSIDNKRHFRANGSLLLPLAQKWRLAAALVCMLLSICVGHTAAAASLTLTVPANLSLSLPPDGAFHASLPATVSIESNAYAGYTFTLKGSDANKQLKNGNAVLNSIAAEVDEAGYKASGNENTWGYLPSKLNSKNNTKFQPGPTAAGTLLDKTETANAGTPNNYTITLGAKVDATVATGTYSNTFTLIVTANNVPYSITYELNQGTGGPANNPQIGTGIEGGTVTLAGAPERDGYEFKGWCDVATSDKNCTGNQYEQGASYTLTNSANAFTLWAMWEPTAMQNWLGCADLAEHETVTLKDVRDNRTYTVAKLKDGNCWMTENLQIQNITLDSTTSDTAGNFVLPASKQAGFNSTNRAEVYDSGNKEHGVYYSWYAATAGEGTASLKDGDIVHHSICPIGWRLPILREAINLGTVYDFNSAAEPPANFKFTGANRAGVVSDEDLKGLWWTSESKDNTYAYVVIRTGVNNAFKNSTGDKKYGFAVRCIARQAYNIKYELNGGSSGPTSGTFIDQLTLPAATPTKNGYKFGGWCTENNAANPATCAGDLYLPGDDYYPSAGEHTVTLYAIWAADPMQNWSNCSKIGENDTTFLFDTRDNSVYKIRKLKDNKCWMTQNLRIGSNTSTTVLDSTTSDMDSGSFTLPKGDTAIGTSSSGGWYDTQYNTAHIYINPNEEYGGYYTWYAATVGEGTGGSSGMASGDTQHSICPKGWRLPTSTEITTVTENGSNSSANKANGNFNVYSGLCDGGGCPRGTGSYGYWWSSTASGSSGAYRLFSDSSYFYLLNGYGKGFGYSVRCVARQ